MIKVKKSCKECNGKYLLNRSNLELAITDANQNGKTRLETISSIVADIREYLNIALEDK